MGCLPKYTGGICWVNTRPKSSVRFRTALHTLRNTLVWFGTINTGTRHFGKFGTPTKNTPGTAVQVPYRTTHPLALSHLGQMICMIYSHLGQMICMIYSHLGQMICMIYSHLGKMICMIYSHLGQMICMIYSHLGQMISITYSHLGQMICMIYSHVMI